MGGFKKDGAGQNGTPVTVNGVQVATTFGGATGGEPTWKTPGAPDSVFGLMAWSAFAWGGLCRARCRVMIRWTTTESTLRLVFPLTAEPIPLLL